MVTRRFKMRDRILATIGMPLLVAGLLAAVPAAAQAPAGSKATRPSSIGKAAAKNKWRTPWGDPDLQGSWSNSTTTPLERPAKYAGREFLTPEERAAADKVTALGR